MANDKETKELLVGINELALAIVANLKQGIVGDFEAVYEKFTTDPDFKAALQSAYENIKAIPAEVGSFGIAETLDLSFVQLSYIPKFVAALKA